MRTNRLFFLKKGQRQINTEAETVVQETQEMGSDVSTANYQKNSSENDANLEMEKSKRPRTENITSAKPEAVILKRRRSYSECDNLSIERKKLCKKLRVNQLYTDYCGRNSFLAAFFRLLGECLLSASVSFNSISNYFLIVFKHFLHTKLNQELTKSIFSSTMQMMMSFKISCGWTVAQLYQTK